MRLATKTERKNVVLAAIIIVTVSRLSVTCQV